MSKEKNAKEELSQYLTFILDGEEYGIPILRVSGIQGWEKTTPIPNSPEFVKGIINLRGEVVPIIDLRKRFGLDEKAYDAHTVVIVIKIEQTDKTRTIGLVVDAVADVYDIGEEHMHATPDFGGKIDDDFVEGLGMINEKMVIILEINNLVDWSKVSESITEEEMENSKAEVEAA